MMSNQQSLICSTVNCTFTINKKASWAESQLGILFDIFDLTTGPMVMVGSKTFEI